MVWDTRAYLTVSVREMQPIPGTSKVNDPPRPSDLQSHLEDVTPDWSESDFEVGDSDSHSSDTEWSSSNDVASYISRSERQQFDQHHAKGTS
ncbi:hypothetical protein PoB_006176200 [Plakobranchus ocellatus]|uniref:Uncharacterized protein n=1 Tax=Plakobranchus ocellatus TaxID=259542 RepID=A0AAV4CTP3_9GAST|nr:hypothetical protein PoB_006176200 [Plakobranchus ocellatus]